MAKTHTSANPLISVVIPVYNEEKNIQEFIKRIIPVLESITDGYEVIFAMDPSTDGTEEAILFASEESTPQTHKAVSSIRTTNGNARGS